MPDLGPTTEFLEYTADRLECFARNTLPATYVDQIVALKQIAFECRSEAFRLRCTKGGW